MVKMAGKTSKGAKRTEVAAFTHGKAKRINIPTAEAQNFVADDERAPKPRKYPRNPDLDPQLVWRGKDEQDSGPLVVPTVPVYIQEKIHPQAIIDDLRRLKGKSEEAQADLFADFNGLPNDETRLEFYQHPQHWSNRMILGDALLVMNSLAEKESLRGKVQTIYIDPPYGIRFASNWQPSTKTRDIKEGKADSVSREPEVVKAFRDTWKDGIHSYLSYLRDRLTVARDLLADSGSVFVQIGDENVHRVRALMDEVFGENNQVASISFVKTGAQTSAILPGNTDTILWYARSIERIKTRRLYNFDGGWAARASSLWQRDIGGSFTRTPTVHPDSWTHRALESTTGSEASRFAVDFNGHPFMPRRGWSTSAIGMTRLRKASRILQVRANLRFAVSLRDFPFSYFTSNWIDTGTGSFGDEQIYVVQTTSKVIQRCLLMTTDPGDLVLDPTCGSGTTAYVAEQWGRRWITIDTSRVALALARTRLMAARFPYYHLKDSADGAMKEGELEGRPPKQNGFGGDLRHGFVYERVPHVTLKSIANNAEIDVIWDKWQQTLEPLRAEFNKALGKSWEEWEIPREPDAKWPAKAKDIHAKWWEARIARQKEIDASIARNADIEFLYDKPYEKKGWVRVTGPFTVESLSPHRVLPPDEEDAALLSQLAEMDRAEGREPPAAVARALRPKSEAQIGGEDSDAFVQAVMENLKLAGVQNTKKNETLKFPELKPYAGGRYIHAEGRWHEGEKERRAAIVIGPEYGTVGRELVLAAAREAVDSPIKFDLLVVAGFAFDPHVGEGESQMGKLRVLKARMNQDLHMADKLKAAGAGNLFVVFGEPDIALEPTGDGNWTVEIKGVDIFDPTTGAVRSSVDPKEDIACWFIDTDYDGLSFFVRHAYFLGGRDPYERLKTTLKAEIDEAAWATLYSAKSRPFPKPTSGQIAVKVINHYGDEVLKVFDVR
jgi:adenine-specific DNA-methyltransferase